MSGSVDPRALRRRLDGVTLLDADRLRRRLSSLRDAPPEKVARVAEQVAAAEALVAGRAAAVPDLTYPDLPVSARRDEIAAAIAAHQVVVVAGATGSGKTTQLPKICLGLGRGVRGVIGHTQPRRLAARTVATRIAEELDVGLGDAVGYTVRFTDRGNDRTLVKLMTDGILLAEIRRDRRLLRYDTLILDEAHERSLNIDFLLGYLHRLLPQRPDLKVIVTSATIAPERFAQHFASAAGPAPIVEVSGRTYPVEIRYRPLEVPVGEVEAEEGTFPEGAGVSDDAGGEVADPDVARTALRDPTDAIVDAVRELESEPAGDVLVFLSGEREIRDTAEVLRSALDDATSGWRTEILPLYARLSTAEQQKVFTPRAGLGGGRRIVLATNVAETSLTVPGIRYVVDPGTARISRFSRRTKVQRLPVEPISQASAAQRAGRCGRTAPGVCIRLYGEDDFAARPEFTDPEILRTNLAAVMLQMAALGLGDVEDFPFLDPPDRRSVRDGAALLTELGALDTGGTLTELGRRLARLPLDPRIGRMLLAAQDEGCVAEMLVLAAALSVPDPRERPPDRLDAAAQKHARFADEHSDFLSYLNLWAYLQDRRGELSGNAFRRMCRDEFLHHLRIREWQDLVGQLRSIARDVGVTEAPRDSGAEVGPADPQSVHAALLAGLLSHVGVREELRGHDPKEFSGARNTRFTLAPGSVLTRRPPRWVVVAELAETTRLYGRVAARVTPEVVERVAGHLVARTYSEPDWDAERGAVMGFERVTLYGLPLVPRRRIDYARVDPALCRELFLRRALVEQGWRTRHHFYRDNAALRAELAELEERARRRDLLVSDDDVFAFYDARIPADVISPRHFDRWWRTARRADPDLLTMTREDLLAGAEDGDTPTDWQAGDVALPLTYRFAPNTDDDGVTVHVPVDVLARLGGEDFAWGVPALREELVTALLRSLPKALRRGLVPVPDTARAALRLMDRDRGPLLEELQRALVRIAGVLVPHDAFDVASLPPHLRVTFAVEGLDGTEVGRGKDLAVLQSQLSDPARRAVAATVADGVERVGLRAWPDDLDEVPRTVSQIVGVGTGAGARRTVRGHPALVVAGDTVDLRVLATEAEQAAAMPAGVRRLLRSAVPSPVRKVERGLDPRTRLELGANPDGALTALIDDCADAALAVLVPAPVWTRDDFAVARARVAARLPDDTAAVLRRVQPVVAAAREVSSALSSLAAGSSSSLSGHVAVAVADVRAQYAALLAPGFVARVGVRRLPDLVRYLTAARRRLERLPQAVSADAQRHAQVQEMVDAHGRLRAALSPARAASPEVADIAWLIEEFRVSLWAQQLGTARPVSAPRILRAIADAGL